MWLTAEAPPRRRRDARPDASGSRPRRRRDRKARGLAAIAPRETSRRAAAARSSSRRYAALNEDGEAAAKTLKEAVKKSTRQKKKAKREKRRKEKEAAKKAKENAAPAHLVKKKEKKKKLAHPLDELADFQETEEPSTALVVKEPEPAKAAPRQPGSHPLDDHFELGTEAEEAEMDREADKQVTEILKWVDACVEIKVGRVVAATTAWIFRGLRRLLRAPRTSRVVAAASLRPSPQR